MLHLLIQKVLRPKYPFHEKMTISEYLDVMVSKVFAM
jgi:hypothetical protein